MKLKWTEPQLMARRLVRDAHADNRHLRIWNISERWCATHPSRMGSCEDGRLREHWQTAALDAEAKALKHARRIVELLS